MASNNTYADIEFRGGAQSRQFMVDLLPTLRRYMESFPFETHFRTLDVGCGAGYGTELLGALYRSRFLGYTLDVYGLDIRPDYVELCRAEHKCFTHIIGDISDTQFTNFCDIVVCSHVIEHVVNPKLFIRRLRELAPYVLLAGPFNEPLGRLTRGHFHSFTEAFFVDTYCSDFQIIQSPGWGCRMTPRYEMFIAEYKSPAE